MKKRVIIKATSLCKKYTEEQILKNLNIEIYEGDFTVIMGSSGSGKTTLLNCLSCMDCVTRGEVNFWEANIAEMSDVQLSDFRKEHIGFVFQEMNLLEHLSVRENIVLPAYLLNRQNDKAIKEHSDKLLEEVGMEGFGERFPKELSGGQRQRIAIARALINSPELLFADEPTGALNSKTSNQILDLLTTVNQKGQSIVMVTHDLKAAIRASRIIYLCDGEIAGELQIPIYELKGIEERETKISKWLQSMGW